ncbi:MAG: hypothetical protein J1F35_02270 [Erysipelotrichales bacterium]|nr:hypothetical protein [Erysipelotrichales bacterium]
MNKEIYEYGKKRAISADRVYSYSEAIKGTDDENYIEFLTLTKGDDYSFYYFNGTFEEKVGIFTIERDSVFIQPFSNLLKDDKTLKVLDDHSDRFIQFSKNENGDIIISIQLLPGEIDGTIELKNVMYDIRSRADASGTNIKEKLSKFFDELIELIPLLDGSQKSLVKK